jgi:hypothetical protein
LYGLVNHFSHHCVHILWEFAPNAFSFSAIGNWIS